MQRSIALSVALLAVLVLTTTSVSAKLPGEVLIQGVGLPYAIRINSVEEMEALAEVFWSATEMAHPEEGTILRYRYVVMLGSGAEPPWDSEWRYFYAPGTAAAPGYMFRAREVTVVVNGVADTFVWVTVYLHPLLDDVMTRYVPVEAGEAQYRVGDPPPPVAPVYDIRPPPILIPWTLILVVAGVAVAVFVIARALHRR